MFFIYSKLHRKSSTHFGEKVCFVDLPFAFAEVFQLGMTSITVGSGLPLLQALTWYQSLGAQSGTFQWRDHGLCGASSAMTFFFGLLSLHIPLCFGDSFRSGVADLIPSWYVTLVSSCLICVASILKKSPVHRLLPFKWWQLPYFLRVTRLYSAQSTFRVILSIQSTWDTCMACTDVPPVPFQHQKSLAPKKTPTIQRRWNQTKIGFMPLYSFFVLAMLTFFPEGTNNVPSSLGSSFEANGGQRPQRPHRRVLSAGATASGPAREPPAKAGWVVLIGF